MLSRRAHANTPSWIVGSVPRWSSIVSSIPAVEMADLAAASSVGLKTAFVPRPNEHGPGKARDITAARQWDVIAKDFEDLATQLGC